MIIKNAVLLAAGRGERLRPFTDATPKPLFSIQGKTLIEQHIARLQAAGVENIIINHAYLGGKLRHYLGNGSRWNLKIYYIAEPPGALETGGGLKRIVQKFNKLLDNHFWVVNTDILTDYDFHYDFEKSDNHSTLGHLVLVNKPRLAAHADFGLSEGFITNDPKIYTFSGIAIYHPKIFQDLPVARYSITPTLRKLTISKLLTGEIHQSLWQDFGGQILRGSVVDIS